MIELNVSYFDQIYTIMEEAFPLKERRSYEGQLALFQRNDYHVMGNLSEGKIISFIAYYETADFLFLEHLATRVNHRGSGVGKGLMKEFFHQSRKPILFEVEPPNSIIAKRRIGFYKRLGCHLYENIPYQQPSFYEDQSAFPLLLMSSPNRFSENEMKMFIDTIYQEIYHINPLLMNC